MLLLVLLMVLHRRRKPSKTDSTKGQGSEYIGKGEVDPAQSGQKLSIAEHGQAAIFKWRTNVASGMASSSSSTTGNSRSLWERGVRTLAFVTRPNVPEIHEEEMSSGSRTAHGRYDRIGIIVPSHAEDLAPSHVPTVPFCTSSPPDHPTENIVSQPAPSRLMSPPYLLTRL